MFLKLNVVPPKSLEDQASCVTILCLNCCSHIIDEQVWCITLSIYSFMPSRHIQMCISPSFIQYNFLFFREMVWNLVVRQDSQSQQRFAAYKPLNELLLVSLPFAGQRCLTCVPVYLRTTEQDSRSTCQKQIQWVSNLMSYQVIKHSQTKTLNQIWKSQPATCHQWNLHYSVLCGLWIFRMKMLSIFC